MSEVKVLLRAAFFHALIRPTNYDIEIEFAARDVAFNWERRVDQDGHVVETAFASKN